MKNSILIIREYILIAWLQSVLWIRTKWFIWTHWFQFRAKVREAKDLWRQKGSQHHVVKIGQSLRVVDNKWRKNYNRIIRKKVGRRGKIDYVKLREMALYSTK